MDNFSIDIDLNKCTIFISYKNIVEYRTLLNSLNKLISGKMLKATNIILDFSEVRYLRVHYSQLVTFRQSIKYLLPRDKVRKIAVIDAPKAYWGKAICSTVPMMENELLEVDLQYFNAEQKNDAVQWLS